MQALGIDISNAGSGPEGAKEFLGRLSHERQRGLVNGCRATLASPYFAAYYVLSFCQNLVSATQNFPRARRPSPRATGWRRMVCCRHLAQRARAETCKAVSTYSAASHSAYAFSAAACRHRPRAPTAAPCR